MANLSTIIFKLQSISKDLYCLDGEEDRKTGVKYFYELPAVYFMIKSWRRDSWAGERGLNCIQH